MSDLNEESPILAAPHYYFSSCGLCGNSGTKSSSGLKRCSRCKVMFYCSADHQKFHWKSHKNICNYLSKAALDGDIDNFFDGHCQESREEWNKFRMNAVKTCSIILSRSLDLFEQEMFLFPRVCRTTGCFSTRPRSSSERMVECGECLSVVWCCDQHQQEGADQHAGVCRQLRLTRVADRYESQVRVGLPSIPSQLDKIYLGTAPDITHFIDAPPEDSSDAVTHDDLEFAFLTNHLSGPLTLLNIGHRFITDFGSREHLTINIAGANIYEVMGLIKWEYLAHRLPALKSLQLNFVGPELEEEEQGAFSVGQCDQCSERGTLVEYNMFSMTYQHFRHSQHHAEPDLVLVQNCGFHEYELDTEEWSQGWSQLGSLLHSSEVPLIFTSYTQGEANKDLERFLSQCGHDDDKVEVMMSCDRNVMRSHRPIRDWEMDQDRDIFYSNQFISVVKLK